MQSSSWNLMYTDPRKPAHLDVVPKKEEVVKVVEAFPLRKEVLCKYWKLLYICK